MVAAVMTKSHFSYYVSTYVIASYHLRVVWAGPEKREKWLVLRILPVDRRMNRRVLQVDRQILQVDRRIPRVDKRMDVQVLGVDKQVLRVDKQVLQVDKRVLRVDKLRMGRECYK